MSDVLAKVKSALLSMPCDVCGNPFNLEVDMLRALVARVEQAEAEVRRLSDFVTGRVLTSPDREYYDEVEDFMGLDPAYKAQTYRNLRAEVKRLRGLVETAHREGWIERGLLPDCGMPPVHSWQTAWDGSDAKATMEGK